MLIVEDDRIILYRPKQKDIDLGFCGFCGEEKAMKSFGNTDKLITNIKELLLKDKDTKLCQGCNTSFNYNVKAYIDNFKWINTVAFKPTLKIASGHGYVLPSTSDDIIDKIDLYNIQEKYDKAEELFNKNEYKCSWETDDIIECKEAYALQYQDKYNHILKLSGVVEEIASAIVLKLLDRGIAKDRHMKKYPHLY